MRLRISIRGRVRTSVGPTVGPVLFSKVKSTHTRRILCRVSGLVQGLFCHSWSLNGGLSLPTKTSSSIFSLRLRLSTRFDFPLLRLRCLRLVILSFLRVSELDSDFIEIVLFNFKKTKIFVIHHGCCLLREKVGHFTLSRTDDKPGWANR